MDNEKAIRAAKLTLGGILEKRRAKTAVDRAQGQIAPSKYLPGVPRQAHAAGGAVSGMTEFDDLHPETQNDIMSHLAENLPELSEETAGGSRPEWLKPNMVGLEDPLIVRSIQMPISSIKGYNRNPSKAAVSRYADMLSKSEAPPILVDGDRFVDGGHRLAAYMAAGRSSIPAVDIGPLLRMNWSSWLNGETDESHPVMSKMRAHRATGGYVPSASLPVPKLAVARPLQQAAPQPTMFDALTGLASLGEQARGVADLVSPDKATEPAEPAQQPHAARAEPPTGGMTPEAIAAMDALRAGWDGDQFGIVSAYRDPEHNQAVGGAKHSQHIHGNAYDVNTTGWTPEQKLALASDAYDAGFRGFGFYDNNMHFDVADPRAWGPSYSRDSIPDWAQPWVQERLGYADGGEVADLGQAREQKQLRDFHGGMMNDIRDRMTDAMEAHQKAVDQGVFDGYEVGDVLQANAGPMRITGKFMAPWKPTKFALQNFERMKTQPTIIEHNGRQYIPMLRYQTGREGDPDWQEGHAYFDGVKAAGYPKMGGLRAVKADGGSVAERSPMFEGMSEHLLDDEGKPMELWHGTQGQPFEAFDDKKIGQRDAGFYGRGHYLTPTKGNAEGYADPDEMGTGSVMGPLHAALKNPFIWDTSDKGSHRTLRDLQSMGIMKGQDKLEPWDNLQRHHIDPFMREMQRRGHDGVLMKTNRGLQEIVVFNPNMIKHRDAEVGDPNDPRIMRNRGGKVDLYSKAAKVIRGLKDQPMDVADIVKYALGKGVKNAEIAHSDIPPGKARPSQVAEHIEFMQPQIGVVRKGEARGLTPEEDAEFTAITSPGAPVPSGAAMERYRELSAKLNPDTPAQYAQYQLPNGQNYREHILTLDNHPEGQKFVARNHWGKLENPLAHIRMSDRIIPPPHEKMMEIFDRVMSGGAGIDGALEKGLINQKEAATLARNFGMTESPHYDKPGLERKILHVEEMQSDWNNAARASGFRTGRERQDYDDYVANMRRQMVDRINAGDASPMIKDALLKKAEAMDPYMLAMKLGVQAEHNDMARRANENLMAPPKGPYINPKRDDWAELAMKHVLTEAAKGGYDGVTFTPDVEQSARWGGTNFDGIYDKKLPGMAHRLVQQHDPETQPDTVFLPSARGGNDASAAMIPLSQDARDSIMKNSFSSFRRGGYVTHIRRGK